RRDSESAPARPSRRLASALCGVPRLARARGAGVSAVDCGAGGVVVGLVGVGVPRAGVVARPPWASAGPRFVPAAARLAASARVGGAAAVRGHVHRGAVSALTEADRGGQGRTGTDTINPVLLRPPLSAPVRLCLAPVP